MKKLVTLFIIALAFGVPLQAHAEQITISVKGMVCSFCAQGIKKTFSRKDGVNAVQVDLDKKVVTITTKKGATLNDTEIQQSIVDAGFEVIKIERTPDA